MRRFNCLIFITDIIYNNRLRFTNQPVVSLLNNVTLI